MAAPLTRRSGCLSTALFLVALVGAHAPRGSRRLRGTPTANATISMRSVVKAPADRRRLAAYNYQEVAKLTAADAATNDRFGYSVAIDGETVVIGAYQSYDGGSGSVYILRTNDGSAYGQVAKLTAADAAAYDSFGYSVAIDGSTVVVGAHAKNSGRGAVYVFRTSDGGATYVEVAKLTADDAAASDAFGRSVAIAGDSVVVGADQDDSERGSVYIFHTSNGGASYNRVAKLTATDAVAGDEFGRSVAIAGDTVVVGAYAKNSGRGAAYVFRTTDGGATYVEVAKLTASDAAASDNFGYSVAIAGATIVIGARSDADAGSSSGSACVFQTSDGGATYGQVAKLTASDAAAGDYFGWSVAIDGATVVVGGTQWLNTGSGAVYIFRTSDGGATYAEVVKLTAADAAEDDWFGVSVAIEGDTVVIGAYLDDDSGPGSGSAYIFDANMPTSQPTTSEPTSRPTTSEPTSWPTTSQPRPADRQPT